MTELRVIKLGGSLLERPDLRTRVDRWLEAAVLPATNIIVAGGGRVVDAIRDLDRVHQFDPCVAHWLAIGAMSLTGQIASKLLGKPLARSLHEARAAASPSTFVLDVAEILRTDEPQAAGVRLEAGWHVTSDSIAARIAKIFSANELVLLKSAPSPSQDIAQLAERGYVDAFFPRIARELPAVRFIDFAAI
jgi:aspartokinase-like uncharacterized kinase